MSLSHVILCRLTLAQWAPSTCCLFEWNISTDEQRNKCVNIKRRMTGLWNDWGWRGRDVLRRGWGGPAEIVNQPVEDMGVGKQVMWVMALYGRVDEWETTDARGLFFFWLLISRPHFFFLICFRSEPLLPPLICFYIVFLDLSIF